MGNFLSNSAPKLAKSYSIFNGTYYYYLFETVFFNLEGFYGARQLRCIFFSFSGESNQCLLVMHQLTVRPVFKFISKNMKTSGSKLGNGH